MGALAFRAIFQRLMNAPQLARRHGRGACFVLAQALVCALGCGRIGYELVANSDGVAVDASVDSSMPASAGGAHMGGTGGSGGTSSGAGGASGGASGSSGSGGVRPSDAGSGGRAI